MLISTIPSKRSRSRGRRNRRLLTPTRSIDLHLERLEPRCVPASGSIGMISSTNAEVYAPTPVVPVIETLDEVLADQSIGDFFHSLSFTLPIHEVDPLPALEHEIIPLEPLFIHDLAFEVYQVPQGPTLKMPTSGGSGGLHTGIVTVAYKPESIPEDMINPEKLVDPNEQLMPDIEDPSVPKLPWAEPPADDSSPNREDPSSSQVDDFVWATYSEGDFSTSAYAEAVCAVATGGEVVCVE